MSTVEAMSESSDLARLTEDAGWVRALARSLTRDAHAAEDLAQDAWVAALQSRPQDGGSLRGWLATVLRRRWAEVRREGASRAVREERAARREALPPANDVVARAALHRDLVQAVLELDEPYRTALLLRFFEGLPQREIARRTQASVATVNSRLGRGLERLRQRLDRKYGDRSTWLVLFVPFARGPSWISQTALGAALMNSSMKIGLAAASVVAALVWVKWIRGGQPSAPERMSARIESSEPLVAAATREGSAGEISERVATPAAEVAKPREAPAVPAPAAVAPRIVRGRVVDASGAALAGVALRGEPILDPANVVRARADANGAFELAIAGGIESIVSDDPALATVMGGAVRTGSEDPSLVVVAPSLALAGEVIDEHGAPLEGVELSVALPALLGADFGELLDFSHSGQWATRSGARGVFELAGVPAIERATLHATLGGYEPHVEPLPAGSDLALTITLRAPRTSDGMLAGVVLDRAGAVVPNARVSNGSELTSCDSRGEFRIAAPPAPPSNGAQRIVALARGHQPALLERGADPWPAWIELRLGPAPLAIAGRVVDADAKPIAGAKVWLDDVTVFGTTERDVVHVETLLGRSDEPFWAFATSDPQGRFRIEGASSRDYRVRALDPRTLAATLREGVHAGASDVELVLPSRAVFARVAGVVVDSRGTPLSGVSVRPYRMTLTSEIAGGTRDTSEHRDEVLTNDVGEFELRDLAQDGAELFVSGDEILFKTVFLSQEAQVEHLRVVVSRRMHLQVELAEPRDRADTLRVLDESGKVVVVRLMRGEGSITNTRAAIEDGRSHVLSVSETARTLVLLRGDIEVARLPLDLAPGVTNVVRW